MDLNSLNSGNRELLIVPFIHPFTPRLRERFKEEFGDQLAEKVDRKLEELGNDILSRAMLKIQPLKIDVIFLESLCDEDQLYSLDEELAHPSKLGEIVKELMKNGARLEITENPKLYDLAHRFSIPSYSPIFLGIHHLRDIYMSYRIGRKLGKGERGIIFYGVAHNVVPYLRLHSPDIRILRVISPSEIDQKMEEVVQYFGSLL